MAFYTTKLRNNIGLFMRELSFPFSRRGSMSAGIENTNFPSFPRRGAPNTEVEVNYFPSFSRRGVTNTEVEVNYFPSFSRRGVTPQA
ncbi:MAG: hypothetical protein ISS17_07645 [Bacteroidales bacterium]|nr:hypothetical protein [Bacteroidales bacterium]